MDEAIRSMTTLNKYAAKVLSRYEVHACTDVTGFSLLGHLSEMLGMKRRVCGFPPDATGGNGKVAVSRLAGAVIHTSAVPHFKRVREFVEEDFFITANGQRNRNHLGDLVEFHNTAFWQQELLFDPQTSGGLLAAVPNEIADEVLTEIKKLGLPCSLIGEVTDQLDHILVTA